MTQPDAPVVVLCNDCRNWFDKKLPECPTCEKARPAFNKSLRMAELNSHLYGMAGAAQKEKALERQIASGRNPLDRPPPV